jgi:serine/threonine protein kinase
MEATLRFIHNSGWLHGDVKPSNIFLDYLGGTWLGDYGSSVTFAAVDSFTGGTPAFQCEDIRAADNALRFDLTGLAISVMVLRGLLTVQEAPYQGWPSGALDAARMREAFVPLREKLAALMMSAAH